MKSKLDNHKLTPFQKEVYKVVKKIPFGEVRSYKWVAERIGKPRAYRAVGQALKKNPYTQVIPCHRVICSNGSLGGYVEGLKKKLLLLEKEGVDIKQRK
ncbi:MAG: MGMT family protein [Candidatus Omnitrophica bacterium]|nr:MGMT family protein [Candidatus Omnitrophota bacterium]